MVMYEDFIETMEQAAAALEGRNPRLSSVGTKLRNPYINGNGYDGLNRTSNDGFGMMQSQQQRRGMTGRSLRQSGGFPSMGAPDDDSVRESMQRFRRSVNVGKTNYGGDDDSSYNRDLLPPKVTDSMTWNGLGAGRGAVVNPQQPRYRSSAESDTARDSAAGLRYSSAGVASPSRIGSKMWGSNTPLAKKGRAPRVGDDRWCCTVCMYMENPSHAKTCGVCDSPNYAVRKVIESA